MQYAIDAAADAQHIFIRFDVYIRGIGPHRFLEHCLYQAHHRCVALAAGGRKAAQIEGVFRQVLADLVGQAAQLVGVLLELMFSTLKCINQPIIFFKGKA